jgi:hypothetical protein
MVVFLSGLSSFLLVVEVSSPSVPRKVDALEELIELVSPLAVVGDFDLPKYFLVSLIITCSLPEPTQN